MMYLRVRIAAVHCRTTWQHIATTVLGHVSIDRRRGAILFRSDAKCFQFTIEYSQVHHNHYVVMGTLITIGYVSENLT